MGKHFQHYHLNTICHSLGEEKCKSLPFYHAFTGCDTTSQFLGKGKKTSWGAWKAYSSATTAFQHAVNNPFEVLVFASTAFQILEQFTCILYDKTTSITIVNDLRQDLFSKRAKLMGQYPTNSGKGCIHKLAVVVHFCFLPGCIDTAYQLGIVPGKYLEHLPQDTTKHPNTRGIWLDTT